MQRSAIRPDGTLDVVRHAMPRSRLDDLYHLLITLSWPGVLALLASCYFLLNLAFGLLYLAGGNNIANARPGSLVDAMEFSVQTFATIGYGVFSPATPWAHFLVSVEALVGIVFSALATGLMFAKFARPTAKVLFARRACVSLHEGKPTLMLRIANGRSNLIMEANATLRVSRMETTREGVSLRRFYDIDLLRSTNSVFALGWTLFHVIDEKSPLRGQTPAQMVANDSLFILLVTGIDDTVVANVHARHVFTGRDLAWNERYVDVMVPGEDGRLVMHYDRFHDTVPVDEAHRVTVSTDQGD